MPSFDLWLIGAMPFGWANPDIAVNVGNIIADKPTTIVVTRNGAQLASQVVRIETLAAPQTALTSTANTAEVRALVVGYKNHPSTTDTDLKRGDRFLADDMLFDVESIQPGYTDRLLAICKAAR